MTASSGRSRAGSATTTDHDVASIGQDGLAIVSVQADEVAATIGPRRQDALILGPTLGERALPARAHQDTPKRR